MQCEMSDSEKFGTAENNVAASQTRASRAISLRPAIISILSVPPRLPALQRLFQFHAPRSLQQNHVAVLRLARQPLARLFRRRQEFCPDSSLPQGVDHGF